jgi:protein gp37
MSENSKIAWTDHTFNPWIGCTRVSPGCQFCYAETLMDHRYGRVKWGKGQPRSRTSPANWKLPLKWNREWKEANTTIATSDRPLVFCASLADWLADEVPIEWLADLLALIHATPNLIWQLLTKRPENWRSRMEGVQGRAVDDVDGHPPYGEAHDLAMLWCRGEAPRNVWMGVTAEDQQRADERIPKLLEIPAVVRWLSCEPLLGGINFGDSLGEAELISYSAFNSTAQTAGGIDWVIVGCESHGKQAGRNAENYEADALGVIEQCRAAGAPVFNKQMPIDGNVSHEPDEWPEALRVRQFPKPFVNFVSFVV